MSRNLSDKISLLADFLVFCWSELLVAEYFECIKCVAQYDVTRSMTEQPPGRTTSSSLFEPLYWPRGSTGLSYYETLI